MVVSAAFEELTELLKCLETSDAEIRNVALAEQMPDADEEITADLTVGLPVLPGVSLGDGVSVAAEDVDVRDQRVEVDLSVTLPVGEDAPEQPVQHAVASSAGSPTVDESRSNSVPAYKDPEALRAVYETHDTFPEMTEALGADVTSETVRRYMVKYDIHDPSDNTPGARDFSPSGTGTESGGGTEVKTGESAASRRSDPSQSTRTESDTPPSGKTADDDEPAGREASTDGRGRSVPDASDRASDGLGGRSVATLLAESDSQGSDDELVADGLGIPRELTVAELAEIVNESNTTHEVKRRLDISQTNARRLLKELDLIDFVTHRLAADQITVSPAEIERRIDANGH